MLLTASCSASAESPESGTPTKNISKHGEDIIHIHGGTEVVETAHTTRTRKSELIIALALLRIMQYIVSLSSFLKLLLSFLVARITIWVIFDGNRSIRLLYLVLCGVFVNAQHFIIVSFLCHKLLSNSHLCVANYFFVQLIASL